MAKAANAPDAGEGLRERKRRETMQRIAEAGMRLFLTRGYDATTLEDITAEAGISRRTFFYYFKSKDDILMSMQAGMGTMIVAALQEEPADQRPLVAVGAAVARAWATYPAQDMIALDRLMRSSPVVQARKQASYVEHERTLYEALRLKWPQAGRDDALRLTAMMAIGAIRLSTDTFSREGGTRPLVDILRETFATLAKSV